MNSRLNCLEKYSMKIKTYPEDGEIIVFSDFTGDPSNEKTIIVELNGRYKYKINYTELKNIYLKKTDRGIYCSTIKDDEGSFRIASMNFNDFWKKVYNKRYIISVDSETYSFRDPEGMAKNLSLKELREIYLLLEAGNNNHFDKLFKPFPCCQFLQI